jgi:hypothetical protein
MNLTPIIMDLKAKIEELSALHNTKALSVSLLKDEMKVIKKNQEIEAVEEKPLV